MLEHNASDSALKLSFWQQVYRHRLSLLSLLVALISLGYNTWRNEATEDHRNIREAGFHVLLQLGELEQIVSHRHYFLSRANPEDVPDHDDAGWVKGWAKLALIMDLSQLLNSECETRASELKASWQRHAVNLHLGPRSDQGSTAEKEIDAGIESMREVVLDSLLALN